MTDEMPTVNDRMRGLHASDYAQAEPLTSREKAIKLLNNTIENHDDSIFEEVPEALKVQYLALLLAMAEAVKLLESEPTAQDALVDDICQSVNNTAQMLESGGEIELEKSEPPAISIKVDEMPNRPVNAVEYAQALQKIIDRLEADFKGLIEINNENIDRIEKLTDAIESLNVDLKAKEAIIDRLDEEKMGILMKNAECASALAGCDKCRKQYENEVKKLTAENEKLVEVKEIPTPGEFTKECREYAFFDAENPIENKAVGLVKRLHKACDRLDKLEAERKKSNVCKKNN